MLHIARELRTEEVEAEVQRIERTLAQVASADEAEVAELVERYDKEDKTDLVLHFENEHRIFKDEFEHRKRLEAIGL